MNLEIFYEKYLYKKGKKEFQQLSKREKDHIIMLYRMWEEGLITLSENVKE